LLIALGTIFWCILAQVNWKDHMLQVTVAVPSGRSKQFSIPQSSKVEDLRVLAQKSCAFAAILADGSVVTWGNPYYGSDSSEAQDQLKGVRQIQSTGAAFAAIVADGSVVTWGFSHYGGDSSAVADHFAML
jgi:hypothetical protein